MHPILDCLDNTPHDWLKKLLYTFNEGDIGKFDALVPLFSKEVLERRRNLVNDSLTGLLATPCRQSFVPATESVHDGIDRVCVQTDAIIDIQSDPDIPGMFFFCNLVARTTMTIRIDDSRGDASAC